jgi:hypothetical protein
MKFILTRELGRLSKWLRILGFDAAYFNQDNLSSLIIQALRDERIILTRNLRLLRPSGVKVVLIKDERIKEQINEVLKKFNLKPSSETMFSRCIICNEELVDIEKEKIKDRVPEYVFKTQEDFVTCPQCKRIYWQGTHWGNAREILDGIHS